MDINVRTRTRTIREIQMENVRKTAEHLRQRRESMRGIHQTRPKGYLDPDERESIKSALKGAFK